MEKLKSSLERKYIPNGIIPKRGFFNEKGLKE